MGLTETEIAARYRRVYGLDEAIGYEHAQRHWDLERRLTDELLRSTPANRWDAFSRAYTELYESLPWLNAADQSGCAPAQLKQWSLLIPDEAAVFEIGSGRATLLKYLHSLGHGCVATEITKERGSKHAPEADGLVWHNTDGIHLDQFEPRERYDVLVSTDVVEHFHPADLEAHFERALAILKPGGRYILTTPHVGSGPHDLSRVFGLDRAVCMHLREYDFIDLGRLLRGAGFRSIRAVFPPSRIFRKVGLTYESGVYFLYLSAWDLIDRAMDLAPARRRAFRGALKYACVPDNIWISAEK